MTPDARLPSRRTTVLARLTFFRNNHRIKIASMVIRGGAQEYCFFWKDQVQPAGDVKGARKILSGLFADPKAKAALSKLPGDLGETAQLDDEALLAKLEGLIVAGRLLIGSDHLLGRSGLDAESPATPERPSAAPAAQPTTRAPEEERPTFQPRHDGAAQAGALRAAAEQGTPFCEECERAAKEQQAA